MQFRRVRRDDGFVYEVREWDCWVAREGWEPFGPSPYSVDYQVARDDEHRRHTDCALPLQPLSFRDFMLFEQHNVDAARGLLRRFHPRISRVASAYEKTTRRVFPMLRPHRLFYRQPMYYMSNHVTFLPSGAPVAFPNYSSALDWELELGFALSRPLRDATSEEALAAIGGFMVLNDFSARDVQREEMSSGFGPQKAKHFANSLSETIVTPEEVVPRIDEITGSVSVNGSLVSEVSAAGMQWSIGEMLAHASRSETLLPGEVFATGTLPGGSGMEVGRWLEPGDQLTLVLDGIGRIEHTVVAAPVIEAVPS
ncbi:hypothetical protein KEM60_00286 [Austwickia sp. TVS 96-490-7B]|uniref:fumarylacetoacetate hydrolase family protein n=1 Tax=Austwickia sp. TVS 96-490-7B TaxID=2830843 RepID=UPI001C57E2B7|nr:fumarylacetoacetate hydrolase family protein [Austwickia sp. TVS 96-490-7B]MBW3084103.1 hypothetical protein [Austwickia sp. TVS 96-490-7B]